MPLTSFRQTKVFITDIGGIILKKKIFFLMLLLIIILIFFVVYIFFIKNTAKNLNIGNNNSSQEIVNKILNIKSYEATIEMEVQSNKNISKYKIKQHYIDKENNFQEVLEPSNIQGVKIEYKDNKLTLSNTKLNLVTIFENYKYLAENNIDLYSFIEDYKSNNKSKYYEENDYIIMQTESSNENIYMKNKKLYIDKKTLKPVKMIINSDNQKEAIYISYNEVEIIYLTI